MAEIDRAAQESPKWNRGDALPSVADDVLNSIAALPPERHGLPLLLSVGRLHRVKGLALLLEAWAGDDVLHRSLKLEDVCAAVPRAREGLVLLGHRTNRDVATMLRIALTGLGGLVGSHGIYACTSQKEEFGVALLEAMATGLAVIAPNAGGPATYIREGSTGWLADTASATDVRRALRRAATGRADETQAQRASSLVRSHYTIEAMATSLAGVYTGAVRESEQVAA